jgi:hypothetical protein
MGSIGRGGRYDSLVSMFQETGKVTPCVRVSVGIERIFALMEERYVHRRCDGERYSCTQDTLRVCTDRDLQLVSNSCSPRSLRQEQRGSIKQPNVTILVASADENLLCQRMKLTKLLWDANISAEFSQQDNPKLKFEIASALERDIPFMVIAGEEEAREGKCKVKDLRARTEDTVELGELAATLRGKGAVPVGCQFAMELLRNEKDVGVAAAAAAEPPAATEGGAAEEEQERRMVSIWVKPVAGVDPAALFAKIKETMGDTPDAGHDLWWDDNVKVENDNLCVTFSIALSTDFDEEVMEVIECMEEEVADQGVIFQTAME